MKTTQTIQPVSTASDGGRVQAHPLSRRQLLAVTAHDFDMLTDHQIAMRFGVSRSAIAMRRLRARRLLASIGAATYRRPHTRVGGRTPIYAMRLSEIDYM